MKDQGKGFGGRLSAGIAAQRGKIARASVTFVATVLTGVDLFANGGAAMQALTGTGPAGFDVVAGLGIATFALLAIVIQEAHGNLILINLWKKWPWEKRYIIWIIQKIYNNKILIMHSLT